MLTSTTSLSNNNMLINGLIFMLTNKQVLTTTNSKSASHRQLLVLHAFGMVGVQLAHKSGAQKRCHGTLQYLGKFVGLL